jgi:hypothetical protein
MTFTLDGAGPLTVATDLLGLWRTTGAPGESLSFDTSTAPDSEMLVWRVSLPNDARSAKKELADGQVRLHAAEYQVSESTGRIATLVKSESSGPSFDTSAASPAPSGPELELLTSLREVNEPVAFGLREQFGSAGQAGLLSFESAIQRLGQFIAQYARVDTQIEGQLVGSTVVGWTGSVCTIWRDPPDATLVELHQRTLELALESRAALIRTLAVAVRGAVILATLPALATTPAGAILALPAAWKFVNQVVTEMNKA